MARYSKDFFNYLARTKFANAFRHSKLDNESVIHPFLASPAIENGPRDISRDKSDRKSISIEPSLIELFKQSEAAMQRLRSTKQAYKRSDTPTQETLKVSLEIDQLSYDYFQERFHRSFWKVLAEANLVNMDEEGSNSQPAEVEVPCTEERCQALDELTVVDKGKAQDNDQTSAESERVFFEREEAIDEEHRVAIREVKARVMHLKDAIKAYATTDTYLEKVQEYEQACETGECSMSREDFDLNYADEFQRRRDELAEAEDDFWTAIGNAERRCMVVDTYVADMQEEDPDHLSEDSGGVVDDARELYIDDAAFERFKARCGVWIEDVPTHEDADELPYHYQPDPLLPEDKVLDRDIVGAHSGVLFGRPQ